MNTRPRSEVALVNRSKHPSAGETWVEGGPRSLVSLRGLLHVLRRRKGSIALGVIAGGLVGYVAGSILPRSYAAEGLLVVDTQELNIPELRTVTSQRTVEPWGARSEARVLTSRENVERAVAELGLEHHPAYNGPEQSPLRQLLTAPWLPEPVQAAVSELWPAAHEESRVEAGPQLRGRIVDEIRRDLRAESEERSYAILLSYRSKDPGIAAAIVNAVMNAYVHHEVSAKQEATRRASQRLKARLDEIWAEWQESNEAIRAMERDEGLVQTGEGTISSQAMAALVLERLRLRTERARAVADRAQIAAALEDGSLNVINPDLVSPRLRSLWEQEAALRVKLAELGVELGERHPQMVALQSDVADLEGKLAAELRNIQTSLEQHISTLQQRDRELGDELARADREASASAEGRALLNQLEREAEMKGELYALYRERYEQTLAALDMHSADVRIASRAVPPERPSSPGPNLLGAAGAAFGLLLSCSVIVSRRWLHDRVETLDEMSELTGVRGLGAIPRTTSLLHPRRKMSELVVRQPDSSVAETMRGILLRIQLLAREGGTPKVLLVTSPRPTDGKTSLVVTMARIAAGDGLRCLAIDCDFRRPNLAETVGARPQAWLSDFLLGPEHAPTANLVVQDRVSEAHFVLTQPIRPMSRLVLEAPGLKRLIDQARKNYDLVLLDTPPIMNVADPMVLSRLADAFVMVVSAREVDRTTVLEAVHRTEITGCPMAGVVMSRVGSDLGDNYTYAGYPDPRH